MLFEVKNMFIFNFLVIVVLVMVKVIVDILLLLFVERVIINFFDFDII